MFYEISCKSLTTELLLNSKKHIAFHPLPSDVVCRTEGGKEGGGRAGQRWRGIIKLSHALVRSAQRPGQHHAIYISFKTTLTEP